MRDKELFSKAAPMSLSSEVCALDIITCKKLRWKLALKNPSCLIHIACHLIFSIFFSSDVGLFK